MKIELILALLLLPIASAVSDTTPPTLVSFDFEPKVVNVSKSDQNIKFNVQIKDDLTGILAAGNQARIFSPSEKKYKDVIFPDYYLVSGDIVNGTYVSNMTIPQYSESGEWHLSYFYLVDKLSNRQYLNETQMKNLGFPTVLEVKSFFMRRPLPAHSLKSGIQTHLTQENNTSLPMLR